MKVLSATFFAVLLMMTFAFAAYPILSNAAETTTNPGGTQGTNNPGGGAGTNNPGGTQGTTNPGGGGLENPLNNIESVDDLLGAVLTAVVRIGSIILVLALVYIGFLFVVAQGNEEKLKSARNALLWTVIGGLILLGATAIKEVITATVESL